VTAALTLDLARHAGAWDAIRELPMRTILLALSALAAAAVINTQPADAQQQGYPWCAEMPDYATECTFLSRQHEAGINIAIALML
jgi:hypothetical protein